MTEEEPNRRRVRQQDNASLLPDTPILPDGARARSARAMPPGDAITAVIDGARPRRSNASGSVARPVPTDPPMDAGTDPEDAIALPLVGDSDPAPQDPAQQIVGLDALLAHVKPFKAILVITPITALGTPPTWWIPNDRETVVCAPIDLRAVATTHHVPIPLDACVRGAWTIEAEGDTVSMTLRGDEDIWVAVAPGSLRVIRGRGARVLMEACRQAHPAVANLVFTRHGRQRGALITPVAHHLPVVVTCRRAWGLSAGRIDDRSLRFFENAARLVVDAFNAAEVDNETWLLGAQANSRDIVAVVDDRPAIITTADGESFPVVLSYRARQNLRDRGLLRADES